MQDQKSELIIEVTEQLFLKIEKFLKQNLFEEERINFYIRRQLLLALKTIGT